MVSRKRHIAKAVTWRVVASLETFALGWIITGQAAIGASISAVELFSKTILYYLHERAWYRSRWGVDQAGGRRLEAGGREEEVGIVNGERGITNERRAMSN